MEFFQVFSLTYRTQGHPVQAIIPFKLSISHTILVQEIEHSIKRTCLFIALIFHCEEELREKLQNRWPACSREVPSLPPLVKHKKHRQPHFEVDGAKVVQVKTIKK